MSDRYLFKAKRIDNGEWVQGALLDGEKYCLIGQKIKFSPYVENECKIVGYKVDRTTLCQCTGLLDKEKNLIRENDVVIYCDCTEERYVIAWEENKACFEYQQYGCSIMNFDELSGVEVEVIGSIFDNPELLQVE